MRKALACLLAAAQLAFACALLIGVESAEQNALHRRNRALELGERFELALGTLRLREEDDGFTVYVEPEPAGFLTRDGGTLLLIPNDAGAWTLAAFDAQNPAEPSAPTLPAKALYDALYGDETLFFSPETGRELQKTGGVDMEIFGKDVWYGTKWTRRSLTLRIAVYEGAAVAEGITGRDAFYPFVPRDEGE